MFRTVIAIAAMFLAAPLQAAWLTFRNDTKEAVLVQELVTVKGKAIASKPVKLQPGETFREFQPAALTKTIQILEPGKAANKLLNQSDVAIKDKDLTMSIASAGGQVKLTAVDPAKKK